MTQTCAVAAEPVLQASILEIFASRQGEGIRVGEPQTFIRFGGCNITCDYCDTPESIPEEAGDWKSVSEVLSRVAALDRNRPGAVVALTGGEPLLQIRFLEQLVPALKHSGRRIYLETNGTLPRALAQIVEGCDWIAMDWKFESATRRDLWEVHRWFLETGGSKVFVKMVLTDSTSEEEFRGALESLAGVRSDLRLVLQPATSWGPTTPIPLARLASWWELARKPFPDVRIIPQVHRLWEIQ
jgi:organic radical activating enzyme